HRKLFDRDPRLPVFTDKVRVKREIALLLGADWINPLIWEGATAADLPFDTLPAGYVLKANHGANMNLIVRPGRPVDRAAVKRLAAHWLDTDFGHLHREWAYTQIPRRLLVEPLLGDGKPLVDYKFYVFGGKVGFIDVKLGRGEGERETSAIMDSAWQRLPFRYGPHPAHPADPLPPVSLSCMVSAAEQLGGMFPFVRVDLYDVNGRPYFGELTFYPSAGLSRFVPAQFDAVFGGMIPASAFSHAPARVSRRKAAS
ncbi:MAG: hypothetical protein RIR62_1473, partial [Pseudomonadota bacterium]